MRQIPNLCNDEVQFTILTLLLISSFPAGVEVSSFIQPVPNIDRLENFGGKNFKKGVETRKGDYSPNLGRLTYGTVLNVKK